MEINGNTSDGYHTFNELYEFRMMYNAALFNEWALAGKYNTHKAKHHYTGEPCFKGEVFVVVAMLPTGQISNHYGLEYWDLFDIPAYDKVLWSYDGHNPQDTVNRLKQLLS